MFKLCNSEKSKRSVAWFPSYGAKRIASFCWILVFFIPIVLSTAIQQDIEEDSWDAFKQSINFTKACVWSRDPKLQLHNQLSSNILPPLTRRGQLRWVQNSKLAIMITINKLLESLTVYLRKFTYQFN